MIAQPTSRDDGAKSRDFGLRDVAWDRVELVERPAGMAEAAPRNHRHEGAAGGEHRRQHQADVVADSAGGMLVDDRAGQIGPAPVERFARTRHGAREMHALVDVHAAKENRHGERRDLPVADRARCQAGDELPDLLARQRAAVALGADDLLRQHQQIRFSNICDLSVYFSVLNQRRQPWFPRSAMRATPTYDGSPLVLSRMRRLDEHALGVFVRSRQGDIVGRNGVRHRIRCAAREVSAY